MTSERSPIRWAIDISRVLNEVLGQEHFPVRVADVAREYSQQIFPDDPITQVQGDALSSFDGALLRVPGNRNGWGILYNNTMVSNGRVNFTLAHEFGHYLIHRLKYPNGVRCGSQDIVRWDSAYKLMEHEANTFAAYLLMPLDDFRRQIDPDSTVDMDALSHCADRYETSFIAATLRWLEYTRRRAVIVVSRDGYILWSRSSKTALKSGIFFRTSGAPTPIPEQSLAAIRQQKPLPRKGIEIQPRVWCEEFCTEMVIFSENYDFTISLLQLQNDSVRYNPDSTSEPDDLASLIRRNHGL